MSMLWHWSEFTVQGCGDVGSAVSDGGGLIHAAVGRAEGVGRSPLKRLGVARNAASRVTCRAVRSAWA